MTPGAFARRRVAERPKSARRRCLRCQHRGRRGILRAGSDGWVTAYVDKALQRARYRQVDGRVFCATVPGLQGVIATGPTLEACRDQLAEVVEEWVLVRVARGLRVPPLGGTKVEVK